MISKTVSHLHNAVEYFQLVLSWCPVGYPDHTAALTNPAWAHLEGYIRKDLQDIDSTTSLFRDILSLLPQNHLDRPLSVYYPTEALNWRYDYHRTTAYISEYVQLYYDLLPLCAEDTYLRSIAVGENSMHYVINNLPTDASNEHIQLG
ncbi:hypothetical protein DFH29DRAFT_181775 [Suillus ampliporus]|nr:hypothetical protein DFH29DRAFT_181775 [Suillus ampliporus]